RWKVASDPVYDAVYPSVRGPILDLGCGAGVLAAYLRARGCDAPVAGIDHDARKIAVARGLGLRDATFEIADAASFQVRETVVMLDLLHYFDDAMQSALLARAARAKVVIIRDCV